MVPRGQRGCLPPAHRSRSLARTRAPTQARTRARTRRLAGLSQEDAKARVTVLADRQPGATAQDGHLGILGVSCQAQRELQIEDERAGERIKRRGSRCCPSAVRVWGVRCRLRRQELRISPLSTTPRLSRVKITPRSRTRTPSASFGVRLRCADRFIVCSSHAPYEAAAKLIRPDRPTVVDRRRPAVGRLPPQLEAQRRLQGGVEEGKAIGLRPARQHGGTLEQQCLAHLA